jgi:hypothetical protein
MNMKRVMLGGALVAVMLVVVAWITWGRGALPGRIGKNPIPVNVSFRDSLVGQGRVLVLSNGCPRYLTVRLAVQNPTLGSNGVFAVDVAGGSVVEFGWREGWRFASGDQVRVEHADYRTAGYAVP